MPESRFICPAAQKENELPHLFLLDPPVLGVLGANAFVHEKVLKPVKASGKGPAVHMLRVVQDFVQARCAFKDAFEIARQEFSFGFHAL
jgi:hypothetical protein